MTERIKGGAHLALRDAPFTWETLTAIIKTEMIPKQYRGKPEMALAAILTGRNKGSARWNPCATST
jgi:hypothetical protein